MKILANKINKYIGAAFFTVALLSTGSISSVYAQGKAYARLATNPDVVAPKTLEVAVYQVENTLKFKMHYENHTNKDVLIRIKNSDNQVVYQETVRSPKYIRKFDFNTLADGNYTFEVSNRKETFLKEISLQTLSARSLNIND